LEFRRVLFRSSCCGRPGATRAASTATTASARTWRRRSTSGTRRTKRATKAKGTATATAAAMGTAAPDTTAADTVQAPADTTEAGRARDRARVLGTSDGDFGLLPFECR